MYGTFCQEHAKPTFPCYYRPGDHTMKRAPRVRYCPGMSPETAHVLIEIPSGHYAVTLQSTPVFQPETP